MKRTVTIYRLERETPRGVYSHGFYSSESKAREAQKKAQEDAMQKGLDIVYVIHCTKETEAVADYLLNH